LTIELPKLDYEATKQEITDWINKIVHSTATEGIVLGLSGGVDSAVTAALAAEAIQGDRIMALIMPTSFTPKEDLNDALELSNQLGLRHKTLKIDEIIAAYKKRQWSSAADKIVEGNLIARIRMNLAYYYANKLGYIVAGTGDRSEYRIGFFTKFGDGAADIYPIIHLYKTQVRALCKHMNIKEALCSKPSSPVLWPGHKATDEIPVDYPILDKILHALYDLEMAVNMVAKELNLDIKLVKEVKSRHENTQHKRILGYRPHNY